MWENYNGPYGVVGGPIPFLFTSDFPKCYRIIFWANVVQFGLARFPLRTKIMIQVSAFEDMYELKVNLDSATPFP